MKWSSIAAFSLLCSASLSTYAQDEELFQACLMDTLAQAGANVTAGEIRAICDQKVGEEKLKKSTIVLKSSDAAASKRFREEAANEEEAFVITPFMPNYVLLGAHNFSDPNATPYQIAADDPDIELDDVEVKFQLSLKVPLARGLIANNGDLYAAYTNRSFWQAYNTGSSSPFRETNHQPEAWMRFYSGWNVAGMHNVLNDVGIVHQSNGRGGNLSRSWNRIYARFVFEKDNLAFAFQPWYRIKEDEEKDNNPDIEDYLGNFEFVTAYKKDKHEFSLMFRNNLKSEDNRGALQLDWSFPIHYRLNGYVQWFNGYGESLIDYDQNVNSIGIGVKLTDWL
ncbi:MAG: phospholipase A [Proteobacteria bacterium]|nr:phospholipase A [Pseudomonadota bacterium]